MYIKCKENIKINNADVVVEGVKINEENYKKRKY